MGRLRLVGASREGRQLQVSVTGSYPPPGDPGPWGKTARGPVHTPLAIPGGGGALVVESGRQVSVAGV